jgi:hypothetical protein
VEDMSRVSELILTLGGKEFVANALSISPITFNNWVRSGYVPAYIVPSIIALADHTGVKLSRDDRKFLELGAFKSKNSKASDISNINIRATKEDNQILNEILEILGYETKTALILSLIRLEHKRLKSGLNGGERQGD